uniref:ShKT domain-containing protein n=1 Tax=Steinernema glaseri TaxID=37863 RepID=A0A1I8AAF5_9BILA
MMSEACPHSCGLCQMTRCKDALLDCPKMEPMCHDTRFKAIMEQQCARTCGACPTISLTTTPPPTEAPTTTSAPTTTTAPAPTTTALSVPEPTKPSNETCADMKPQCDVNRENCVGTIYSTWMQKYCPQTCGLCPTEPPCADLKPQCEYNKENCVGTIYSTWMLKYCRETCGLCPKKAPCMDLEPECPYNKENCVGTKYSPWMQKYCPYTCGICRIPPKPPAACVDEEPECEYNKPECVGSKYSPWMQRHCPYTCGLCAARLQSSCQDQHHSCGTFKSNGFCSNSFYDLEYRRMACGRTCGLC